ncbi:LuxR C-terminal-related transcriptional regulator [Streptomyces caniferus]|uniref:LuxR C-terminal-related transcriptional regulator n=1 Tax=Streptomyces caniferus TaxID=285557 RepID=UPI00381196CC
MSCPYQESDDGPLEGPVDLSRLTEREKQVLLLLGGGPSNHELSRRLRISERTVKAHISHILIKIGQSTRLQAAMVSALHHHQLCSSPNCRWSLAAGPAPHDASLA